MQDKQQRFEAGYRATYAPLVAYAARRCAVPADVADVVADTFAVYWRRIDDAPEGDRLLPWLYGVGRRVLANQRRGDVRRSALAGRLTVDLERHMRPTPSDVGERSAINNAFRRLAAQDQELLALVAWEGLDREAVAVALGVSRATVRVRLHRARQRFARELETQGVEVDHSARTLTPTAQALACTDPETS